MGINKVLLAKQINGEIEYLYPKTTADMVLCKYGHIPETTVQESLDYISDDIANLLSNKMDLPKNIMGDGTYGDRGQILIMNDDGYPEWTDYIANGKSVIHIKGTSNGGEWGYDNYNDRYQSQVVQVADYNITPNSQVNIQLSSSQSSIFSDNYLSFSVETRTINGVPKVLVFALGNIPEDDYIVRAIVTEVD